MQSDSRKNEATKINIIFYISSDSVVEFPVGNEKVSMCMVISKNLIYLRIVNL